jgi:hypothetical protein
MYNRECGEGLADVKREGADIEKVWCSGAWYINENSRQCFIVEPFIYKIYFSVTAYGITLYCLQCSSVLCSECHI